MGTRAWLGGVLLAAAAGSGQAGDDIAYRQVTVTPFGVGMFEPSISADGARIAFRTTADLTGENPEGNFEIFVADLRRGTTVQLTDTPFGIGNFTPLITPDGNRVIFRSLFDYTGAGNAGTFELWEVDVATDAFRQITDNPANTPVFDPRLSGDGRFAVFTARIDPNGQNPDGSLEVFRVDVATGALVQISDNVTVAANLPDIDGDGDRIVWTDRANYDGTNPEGGLEIWLWDESEGISAVTQQTGSSLRTTLPRIDHAGRFVCFVSLFDFSGAGVLGNKVHLADTQDGTITLLTSSGVSGGEPDYPDAEIAPDGSAVYFESNRDLAGANPDGNRELFRYDVASATLIQATDTTGGASIIQLSDDATRRYLDVAAANGVIAYRSDRNLDPEIDNEPDGFNLDLFAGLPAGVVIPCLPGDRNSDGVVDVADLNVVLSSWQQSVVPGTSGDGDADGDVDVADLNAVLSAWLEACG